MAPITKSLALLSAFFAATSSAAPYVKRDNIVVWETVTSVEWTTVDVTTTVYPPKPTVQTSVVSIETVQPTTTPQPEPVQTSSTPAPAETSSTVAPAPAPVETSSTVAPAPQEPTSTATPVVTTQPAVSVPAPTTTAVPSTTETPTPVETPEPTETPTETPSPASSSTSAPSATSAPSTGACSEGSPCTGQVTYYQVATDPSAPSSCGWTNNGDKDDVLALPVGIMTDSDCGKMVTVKYGGITKQGKVVDKCMGCDDTSIDLSQHFFESLAELVEGRLFGVEWYIE